MFYVSKKHCKLVVLFLSVLYLTSCLTIDSKINIEIDGSGTMTLKYSVNKTLENIVRSSGDGDVVPLNLERNNIERAIGNRDDITYRGYRTWESDESLNIEVVFDFDNLDALNSIFPSENSLYLSENNGIYTLNQGISEGVNEPIEDQSMLIIEDLFSDNYLNIEVTVPSEIINVTNGEKVSGRVAVYNKKVIDIIKTGEDESWSIRW